MSNISHMGENESFEKNLDPFTAESALRIGITVACEVHPRRGYC